MTNQSKVNEKAWSHKAYDYWIKDLGSPKDIAHDILNDPKKYLRRHLEFFGDIANKKILNPLGSCGKKAIALAILGADVTVIDISLEN